jgi:periplasmic protein TonB
MSVHVPRWRAPVGSSPKITLPPGKTTPRFESQHFGSGFKENLKEWFRFAPFRMRGAKMSPLQAGARPAAFNEIWKKDTAFGPSQATALAVHVGAIVLILLPLHRLQKVTQPPPSRRYLMALDNSPYGIRLPRGNDKAGGGGGGGDHSPLPVTVGRPPKFTMIQMAPPAIPRNTNPILVAEASLVGPPELQFPSPNLNKYGDPVADMVNDSGGPGGHGGLGDGDGTGIGPGRGPGLGPGWNGGVGNGPNRPGFNGVGYPICDYCPDAKYSEEARKAKFQGVVLLQVIVAADGRATNIEVVRGPGLGLEEQAVVAVKTWRFKPAIGPNHMPVPTRVAIEVQFRLL